MTEQPRPLDDSRTRRLFTLEVHKALSVCVLGVGCEACWMRNVPSTRPRWKPCGMRSIRGDDWPSDEVSEDMATAEESKTGRENRSREWTARRRKGQQPGMDEPERSGARITKKGRRTTWAQAGHAVDLSSGAAGGIVTLQSRSGDTNDGVHETAGAEAQIHAQ